MVVLVLLVLVVVVVVEVVIVVVDVDIATIHIKVTCFLRKGLFITRVAWNSEMALFLLQEYWD